MLILSKNDLAPFKGRLISEDEWEETVLPALELINDLQQEKEKVSLEYQKLKKNNEKLAEVF